MKKNTLSPKSIIAILFAAIIALTAFVPVSAYGGRVYVADETDSIPAEELAELNEYAEHASETCGTDILFLLAEDEAAAGDSIVDYMANYPNMGNGESRIFFAIGPDSSWYILCGGNMQNMLTKEQEDALRDAYNGPETYFGGIKAYIDLAESYVFEIYPNDTPVDEGLEGLERLPEEIRSMDEFTCVLDGAGMIEPEQRAELMKKLGELSSKYGMDYVVCTVKALTAQLRRLVRMTFSTTADSVAARIEAACCCLSARATGSGIFQQGDTESPCLPMRESNTSVRSSKRR